MNSKILPPTRTTFFALSVVFLASSCSGAASERDGAGGEGQGGEDGDGQGGAGTGGKASGGKGGSTPKGGSGGSRSGGSVGTGGAGPGGSSAGGSSASGGSGGTVASGGSGGSAGQGGKVGAPPPIEGPGVFFSGKDMNITKMVAGDAMPGYVETWVASLNVSAAPPIVAVDDPTLASLGIKYAFDVSLMGNGMSKIGWNWRMDAPNTGTPKAFNWNYFDATPFAGISFWAKTDTGRVFFSMFNFDAMYSGTNDSSTTKCAFPTVPECGPAYVTPTIVGTTWTRNVIPFSKFLPTGMDAKILGRIDLSTAGNFKMLITGITLVTADQL